MTEIISFIKYILQSNIINFLIMLGILYWICKKIDIKKGLDNAIKSVRLNIEKSEDEKSESQDRLNIEISKNEKLPSELKQLDAQTEEKSRMLKSQIESETQKSIENLKKNISKIVESEEKTLSGKISQETVTLSLDGAKDNILNLLNSNPQLHEKFIYQSLEELEKAVI